MLCNYNVNAICLYLFTSSSLYYCLTMTPLHLYSGFGKVDETQIQTMASMPDYALIKPSAAELEPLSTEVLRYTCEGKYIIIRFVIVSIC